MTPEEHYQAAEEWLGIGEEETLPEWTATAYARALVHATLANTPAEQVDVRLV